MNATRRVRVRRIAIAFSATGVERRYLEALTQLAAEHTAEVTAVFIEDTDMIRAANLPFAVELCRSSNVVRQVESAQLERQMKERASVVEKSLAHSAERSGIQWSFTTVRQPESSAIMETARAVDLTMLSGSRRFHLTPAVTHDRGSGKPRDRVVVIIDRSSAARRGLEVALRLADIRRAALSVIVLAGTQQVADRLAATVAEQCGERELDLHTLTRPAFGELLGHTAGLRADAVFLPIGLVESTPERIHELNESLDCPVLIVK